MMLRKLALGAGVAIGLATAAWSAGEGGHVEDVDFSFEGPFGTFDQNQLQRGLKIYTQVCAGCHGLQYVPIRTLSDDSGPGLPEEQVRAYAAEFAVLDEDSNHHLYDPELGGLRPLAETDRFPANNTAGAPDLSDPSLDDPESGGPRATIAPS